MKTYLLFALFACTFFFSACSKKEKREAPTPDYVTGSYEGIDDDYYSGGKVYRIILSKIDNEKIQIQNVSDEGRTIFGQLHSNGKAFSIYGQPFGSGVIISGTGLVDNNELTLSVEFTSTSSSWHESETFTGAKK